MEVHTDSIEAILREVLDPVESSPGDAWGYGHPGGQGDSRVAEPGKAGQKIPAGVLVPFVCEPEGRVSLLFTERTMTVKDHKGQVSFPGGVFEPGDASLLATALRETSEEIGLDEGLVTIVGRLRPYDTITGYRIHPFVGVIRQGRTDLTPSASEIESIFHVDLEVLMDPSMYTETAVEWAGERHTVRAFEWGGPVIWGATANILTEIIRRIRGRSEA